jgi:hypothetical protein
MSEDEVASAEAPAYRGTYYRFVPIGNASPLANRVSNARLNVVAVSALSIMIKSLQQSPVDLVRAIRPAKSGD